LWRLKQLLWIILSLPLCAGCEAFGRPNVPATFQAESRAYVAEATAIAQTAQVNEQSVNITAQAAETKIAEIQAVNLVLLATVRAGDPAQGVTVDTIATPIDLDPNRRWFVKTGVSRRVSEADGCVVDPQINFSLDTQQIYATVRAFNIQSGTMMSVQWYYEGNEVWQDSWTVPQNSADLCIWFDIQPSYVEFKPGNWSVRLFADGFQLEDAMAFALTESDTMSDG
jgi:cellobiose-specific phosphotransferase system component IIB